MVSKKEVTPLDEKFDKIKNQARQAGQNAYEIIALYVNTCIKNSHVKLACGEGISRFLFKFG